MAQTRTRAQLGFPKSRISAKTKRVVESSVSSQIKLKRRAIPDSSKLVGITRARKAQPLKSNLLGSESPTQIKSIEEPRTKPETVPVLTLEQLPSLASRRMSVFGLDRPQVSTAFQKLSVDEHMFILHVYNWGLVQAKRIAALSGYKLRHSLPELLANMSELDTILERDSVITIDMLKRQWYKSQYESPRHSDPSQSD